MRKNIAEKYYIPPGLSEKSVVIDGGAYRGQWTGYISFVYGCRIFAVEPFYDNASFLESLFPYHSNVTIIRKALWNFDGVMELFLDDPSRKNNGCSMYDRFKIRRTVDVNTVTIGTLMKRYSIGRIDLLKLNVEGSEIDILSSFDKQVASCVSRICFAPHNGKIVTDEVHNKMLKHLEHIGYRIQDYTSRSWGPEFRRVVCIHENADKGE